MSNALQLVTDDDLLSLASALRRGDLATPFGNEVLLTQYCPKGLATGVAGTFRQLSLDGFSPPQIARLLETIVETRAGRPELEKLINLVWTGPEVPGQTRRETAPVVRELFASATFSVQVASYAIHKGADIFQPLADRMLNVPSLRVELFVDLNGHTPLDFGQRFLEEAWPPSRPLPVPAPTVPKKPTLPKSPPPQIDEVARLVLELKQGNQRAEAATSLGQLGKRAIAAVPELVRVLDDPDEDVRLKAAAAIVALGRQPVSIVLDFKADWCWPCQQMKPIVAKLLKEKLPILVIDIDKFSAISEKFHVRYVPTYLVLVDDKPGRRIVRMAEEAELRKLVEELGQKPSGSTVAPGLENPNAEAALMAALVGLDDDDAWTQFGAEAIIKGQSTKIAPVLATVFDGKYPARIRAAAVRGLLATGIDDASLKSLRLSLVRSLGDAKEPIEVRGYAALALSIAGDPASTLTPTWLAALNESKSIDLKAQIATRFGDQRVAAAVPALTRALADEADPVREAAAKALGQYGQVAVSSIPQLLAAQLKAEAPAIREALEKLCQSPDALPALRQAMRHEKSEIRLLVLQLLAETDSAPVAEDLKAALRDENDAVKLQAVVVLERLGGHEASILPVLIAALASKEKSQQAAEILSQLGRSAIPALVTCITSPESSPVARLRSARAIRYMKLPRSVMPALIEAVRSDNMAIRTPAALVLSHATPKDEAVVAALILGTKEKNREWRSECLRALGETKSPAAVAKLLAIVGGKDKEDRLEAVGALAQLEIDEQTADQLIALLAQKATRSVAAIALQSVEKKWPKALPALVEAFVAAAEDERYAVGTALANIGKPAIPALLELTGDANRNEAVRGEAIRLVGQMDATEAKEAAPKLLGLIKDKSKLVRQRSAIACAHISKDKAVVPVLLEGLKDKEESTRRDATWGLIALGSNGIDAADPVDAMLKTSEADQRMDLTRILVAIDPESERTARAALAFLRKSETEEVRQSATQLFDLSRVKRAIVPHLIRALSDDAMSQPEVIRTLQAFGSEAKEAVPHLTKLLGASDRSISIAAAIALVQIEPKLEAAIPILIEAVDSSDKEVRHRAIEGLVHYGKAARPAIPVLIRSLKDAEIRSSAAHALGGIGPDAAEAVGPLIALLGKRDSAPAAAAALEGIGPAAAVAVPKLIALLDRETTMRVAASALRAIGGDARKAVPMLVRKLSDENQRQNTLQALAILGTLDTELTLTELFKAAQDSDADYRTEVFRALGGLKSEKGVPILLQALDDSDPEARSAAIDSLGQLGPVAAPAIPALIGLLQGKDRPIRLSAAYALGGIGAAAETAVPALIKALDDKEIQYAAVHAIGAIGAKSVAAVPRLVELLDDAGMQYQAASALGSIGQPTKAALPKLRKLLESKDSEVREAIQSAVEKIEGKN